MYENDTVDLDASFASSAALDPSQDGAEQVAWSLPANMDPASAARALIQMGEIMQLLLSSNELEEIDPAPQDSLRSRFAMSASNVQQASLVSTANRTENFGTAAPKPDGLNVG